MDLKQHHLFGLFATTVVVIVFSPIQSRAQFKLLDMEVGSLTHQYSEIGSEPFPSGGYDWAWPAWKMAIDENETETSWYSGLWIARKNFTDRNGKKWQHKIAHVGPRATGASEFFPTEFRKISKFEPTSVTVDGAPSFRVVADVDEVDPDLPSTRKIVSKGNTVSGISWKREIYAWQQENHDNYHINVYTFTNTGNTDGDNEIEIEDQTAEGVYIHRHRRPASSQGLLDVVGTDFSYTGRPAQEDIRANLGFRYTGSTDGEETLGSPNLEGGMVEGDTLGRLSAEKFYGTATLFASKSADEPMVNDMAQPTTTNFNGCDDQTMAIGQDATNEPKMANEYEEISKGHEAPHHADWIDQDVDFTTWEGVRNTMAYAEEGFDQGGQCMDWDYGPYTLAPGDSIKIVMAEAADGLTPSEASVIGRKFVQKSEDVEAPITFRGETMGKNDWWYTGRDSLMQTWKRAQMHYYEGLGSIPEPPRPPKNFTITSGVNEINLEWTAYGGAAPEGEWELYRAESFLSGLPQNDFRYKKIATFDPSTTSYTDTEVVRGVQYFYYLQAVGSASENDGSIMTDSGPLRSNRVLAQTWDPASLKRSPGEKLTDFRVVPNPLDLTSETGVRWRGRELRVGFLDIPGRSTIRIYTESGQLIKTIEHTDGSGDEFWNLRTRHQQIVASGIYIAVVTTPEGGRDIEKFIIAR
jgi:hypothetical protein